MLKPYIIEVLQSSGGGAVLEKPMVVLVNESIAFKVQIELVMNCFFSKFGNFR